MKTKNLIAGKTTRLCIIPAGRRVEVRKDGSAYFIVRAECADGSMASTYPMGLFLRPDDFIADAKVA